VISLSNLDTIYYIHLFILSEGQLTGYFAYYSQNEIQPVRDSVFSNQGGITSQCLYHYYLHTSTNLVVSAARLDSSVDNDVSSMLIAD